MSDLTKIAKVIAVGPDSIEIEITSTKDYEGLPKKPQIGSYLQISDGDGTNSKLVAVIRGFRIKDSLGSEDGKDVSEPRFILSLQPVGHIFEDYFYRGGQAITIPPKLVELASEDLLTRIYSGGDNHNKLSFGHLSQDNEIEVHLDGDLFFSKHIGVVGSTGSGKSTAVAAILQEGIKASAAQQKAGTLNNSHILVFDLHGEYKSAFPAARVLGAQDFKLPYWLMNSEELEEMFVESNEYNSHNQISQFRNAVILNKISQNPKIPPEHISYDSPLYFSLDEVHNYLANLNSEVIGKEPKENKPKLACGTLVTNREESYFKAKHTFVESTRSTGKKASNGPFHGEFERFLMRLSAKQNDSRLNFLLAPTDEKGEEFKSADLKTILELILGYGKEEDTNVTILDLSGVPFEVLSIVVSLVCRLVFSFCFHFKKELPENSTEVPFLLVLEEAHNYVSKAEGAKYNSVRKAVERIAKEGRKYGVSLMIVSQRPSEISETIFSQCNNFVVMRLTNPTDQGYIKRLLPDNVGGLTDSLSTLEQREALLLGDAFALPSIVKIKTITDLPRSADVKFMTEWRKDWQSITFEEIIKRWMD